jgi:hypothetical protein
MNAPEALVRDLVAWIDAAPRGYDEAMAAWRTSCPRLPVWEDAIDLGLIRRDGRSVTVTAAGRAWLVDGHAV